MKLLDKIKIIFFKKNNLLNKRDYIVNLLEEVLWQFNIIEGNVEFILKELDNFKDVKLNKEAKVIYSEIDSILYDLRKDLYKLWRASEQWIDKNWTFDFLKNLEFFNQYLRKIIEKSHEFIEQLKKEDNETLLFSLCCESETNMINAYLEIKKKLDIIQNI